MNIFHRTFLYLIRKISKTLILFLIILVIATLALSGITIEDASETAKLNVRQALGGIFTLQQNTSDPDKWVSSQVGNFGSSLYYNGAPLTVELADYIQRSVDGIRGYNASYVNYSVPLSKGGSILKLLESENDGSGLGGMLAGTGDFNSTVSTYASTNTAFDSFFSGGYLELTEGRHFTVEDRNVAIISEQLASLNGLKVGDTITLRMSEYKASMMGYDASKTAVEVKIVGLFCSTAKSTTSLSNWSMDNSVYTTFDVVRTVRPDMGDESYEKIQFYVDDPGSISETVDKVKSLPDLNPTDFVVNFDSSEVDAVTEPLTNMGRLVSVLIILVLTVGAVILYLVLSSRIKERVHESGILLSIGLPKRKVILQYLSEVVIIAVFALMVSVFTGKIVAQTVGNQLLDYTMSETAGQDSTGQGFSKDGVQISSSSDYAPKFEGKNSLTVIKVEIKSAAVIGMFAIGLLICCGAVIFASLPVLRMKPREILSKMS